MDRLILLRHGEAQSHAESGRDLDRALTERGRRDAAAAGRALARARAEPELVLVSPAARTRETWRLAGAAWSPAPADREHRELYDVSPAELFELAKASGATSVMLVAHNPGLQALAEELALADPRLARGFPPATAAVLEREGEDWRLAFLHLPEAAET